MILGIDFSIKSSAASILAGDDYTFYTYARKGLIKPDFKLTLAASGVQIFETEEEPAIGAKASIGDRERTSVKDALRLIPTISKCFVGLPIKAWGIEGFSFASTGNRLAQISGYQWALRWELVKGGLDIDNFYIYSPMTIKATAGKGNFKKQQMIEAFMNSQDPLLGRNSFYKSLCSHPHLFQNKKGDWMKPLDDIVDSWWVLKTIEDHIHQK